MSSFLPPQIDGRDALEQLRAADPPLFLSPSSDLSASARSASRYIFSSLLPHCPKPPIESLLTDEEFDAEQIWSQIDLFSRPILSLVRREVKRLERVEPVVGVVEEEEVEVEEEEEEEEEIEEEEEEEEEEEDGEMNGVEDRFLKIRELEDYLEDDEAREFGFEKKGGRGKREEVEDMDEEEEEDEEGDEEDEEWHKFEKKGERGERKEVKDDTDDDEGYGEGDEEGIEEDEDAKKGKLLTCYHIPPILHI